MLPAENINSINELILNIMNTSPVYAPFSECTHSANKLRYLLVDASSLAVNLQNTDQRCAGVLTHSVGNYVPKKWKADLSTEICFFAVESNEIQADLISCDHLDIDALCSIFVFTNPILAQKNKELLIEIARAGDFRETNNQKAANIW